MRKLYDVTSRDIGGLLDFSHPPRAVKGDYQRGAPMGREADEKRER